MKTSKEDLLALIGERVFAIPIKLLWQSQEYLPRNGEHRSQSRGSDGYEIISRQEYELGDDMRDIDHFASAQSGDDTLLTIKFLEPRDICVEAIVDVGFTMQFGTSRVCKSILSAELAASILACADKTQDRTRLTTISPRQIEASVGPKSAKTVFAQGLEHIIEPPD